MDLQHYQRVKFQIAEILRAARMRAGETQNRDQERVRDLFARMAEDRFNLVVVGRFSRGKTSLMNAMLGTDRLPTGVVPLTSVITTVTYGTDEQVVLHYQNSHLFTEIPLDRLAEHITERGNPGNVRGIRTAEVQLPAEILRRGFHFIDTPGLGSSIIENTRTTEAFLPEADAFILVTSYDSPLSAEEQRVLRTIHSSGRRVFIVLNKQDCVAAAERQEVIEHLQTQLFDVFGNAPPAVYSVSAQQALAARLGRNDEQLAGSGILTLESALIDFLVNEKHSEFLLNLFGRLEAILSDQPGTDEEARRLRALRVELEDDRHVPVPEGHQRIEAQVISSTLPICEVCAQVSDAVFNFLARYQHQLHGNQQVQADLARRGGLCAPHIRQFEAIAAPREVCTGFAQVLERQASHLRATARGEAAISLVCQAVHATIPTVATCPACEAAVRAASTAVGAAALRLSRNPDSELRNLSAICIPHLEPLLAAIGDSSLVRRVLFRQADLLDRLSEDMRRFALKQDASRRYLASKEELGAAQRGLRALVGHPNAQIGPAGDCLPENVAPLARRTA
jgi:small GTP-binding protein